MFWRTVRTFWRQKSARLFTDFTVSYFPVCLSRLIAEFNGKTKMTHRRTAIDRDTNHTADSHGNLIGDCAQSKKLRASCIVLSFREHHPHFCLLQVVKKKHLVHKRENNDKNKIRIATGDITETAVENKTFRPFDWIQTGKNYESKIDLHSFSNLHCFCKPSR